MSEKTILKFILFLAVVIAAFIFFTKREAVEEEKATLLSENNVINFEEKEEINGEGESQCSSFDVNTCPSECVICPPCEECSSISCQTEEFCQEMGIDRDWYEKYAKGESEELADEETEIPTIEDVEKEQEPQGPAVPVGDQEFASYTNKAIGYTIVRPDKWYWQHFNTAELEAEGVEGVLDYFIADRRPLIGFGSEYLGEIVIEVTKRDLSDFADHVKDFSKKNTKVGGIDAVRYEGVVTNEIVTKQKWIEYQFIYNNLTFRIIYAKINSTEEEEAIFGQVVQSFVFD